MSRRMTTKVLAATMFGTIDSDARVPVIPLYAQSVGADLVQTGGHRRPILVGPRARGRVGAAGSTRSVDDLK